MNEWNYRRIVTIGAVLIVIFIGTFIAIHWTALEINPDLSTDAYNLLLKYLFIIIVTERSLAVYNTVMYSSQKLSLKRRIKYFKNKLDAFNQLDREDKNDYMDSDAEFVARRKKHKDESIGLAYLNLMECNTKELEKLENAARRFSMRALLFFGIIFAIAGLSILSDILNISESWYDNANTFQARIIKFIDILLTGALIGGGSKSFHEVLSTIQSVLDNVKESQSK